MVRDLDSNHSRKDSPMVFRSIRQCLLVATLPIAAGATGCLDEVPVDGEHLTEEQLAGDGQPDDSEDLIIESGIGVSGALNLWDDRDYSDTRRVRYSYDSDFGNDGFNDKASSLSNRTAYYWKAYVDRDYSGQAVCIRPYSRVSDLSDFQRQAGLFCCKNWGDTISSVKKLTTSSSSCGGAAIIGVR
jgi:hypothetical protein